MAESAEPPPAETRTFKDYCEQYGIDLQDWHTWYNK